VLRHVVRLAVATFAVAAAGVVVSVPAQAATCGTSSGVSVVVDFHQLGGGVQTFCDVGGAGENAATQFEDAGHALTYVQGQPFVCEVDSKPATQCARTPPANAYWSLWWSDGKSGQWKYASLGVTALEVPAGGYVALSWQGQSNQAKPGVAPQAHTTSQPSSSPTKHPSPSTHSSTGPGQTTSSSPGPTTSSSESSSTGPQKAGRHSTSTKRANPSKSGQAQGKSSHGHDSTQAGEPSSEVAASTRDVGASDSGGLPGWVAPVAVALLFAGAGVIALLRRKSSGGA
jgi:hypothetical protein